MTLESGTVSYLDASSDDDASGTIEIPFHGDAMKSYQRIIELMERGVTFTSYLQTAEALHLGAPDAFGGTNKSVRYTFTGLARSLDEHVVTITTRAIQAAVLANSADRRVRNSS